MIGLTINPIAVGGRSLEGTSDYFESYKNGGGFTNPGKDLVIKL